MKRGGEGGMTNFENRKPRHIEDAHSSVPQNFRVKQ